MALRIRVRRGTTAQWGSSDPVLGVGEMGLDTDLDTIKIGDGVTAYSSLNVLTDSASFLGLIDTPSSFSSQANKILRINSGANAIEFITVPWDSLAVVDSKDVTSISNAATYTDGVTATLEDALGNPSTNGDALESTTGGTRSFGTPPTTIYPAVNVIWDAQFTTDIQTAPELSPLLVTVATGETLVVNVCFSYRPDSTGNDTFNIDLYNDTPTFVKTLGVMTKIAPVTTESETMATRTFKDAALSAGDYHIAIDPQTTGVLTDTNERAWVRAITYTP